ncbi:hypothetical protein [Photobacterium sp. GB-72]|uniref:hypothetical protein n=1 Tax=Photobacterium sp. GB-72 TaxID=2022105 RepID=UPI000D1663D2|nr:hypothetical protein [Photobacterium sp. GB-72]PSV28102.1 hypothetical protein C9J40_19675 [Photobacterium sp. GB-72]
MQQLFESYKTTIQESIKQLKDDDNTLILNLYSKDECSLSGIANYLSNSPNYTFLSYFDPVSELIPNNATYLIDGLEFSNETLQDLKFIFSAQIAVGGMIVIFSLNKLALIESWGGASLQLDELDPKLFT